MNVFAITAAPLPSPSASPPAAVPGASFAAWLAHETASADGEVRAAHAAVQDLALGGGSVHDVMLRLERARLSLQLVAQVRSRLLDGYHELMRMQA